MGNSKEYEELTTPTSTTDESNYLKTNPFQLTSQLDGGLV